MPWDNSSLPSLGASLPPPFRGLKQYHVLWAWFFMCAWHDADADLLSKETEVKRPPLPDGRATPTRQGQVPEMGRLEEA